jgi:uncharacterized membrane protein YfcA
MLTIVIASFVFSFIFALGGVGSAIILVPIMYALGIPIQEAKPTGLLINTLSMSGATYSNFKQKILDVSIGLPIIITSLIIAPIGAYVSTIIPTKIVLYAFILFLFFSANVLIFFRAKKYENQFREDKPIFLLSLIGCMAGFVSGLLGVGGGGLISPLMILLGFNPKKVATITAFVVPFSSLTGFVTYSIIGNVNIELLIYVSFSAFIGGYLGTKFMQSKLKPSTVKVFLGLILFVMAVKLLLKVI